MNKCSFIILLFVCPQVWANSSQIESFNIPAATKKIVPDFIFPTIQSESVLPQFSLTESGMEEQKLVTITRIRIEGNTVLTKNQILPVIQPYLGKSVSNNDLQQLRYQISELYFKNGYVNSGVILPDQEISNGIVVFHAIEGELNKIHLQGNINLSEQYILDKINQAAGKPLNIVSLKQGIALLQQDPLIEAIQTRLYPSTQLGQSELSVQVVERKMFQIKFGIDNYRSPLIGSERAWITLQHNNLFGRSDSIFTQFGLTEGLRDYFIDYSFPVSRINSNLGAYYSDTDSRVISEEARSLDIENRSSIFGFSWTYDVASKPYLLDKLKLSLEKIKSDSSILGGEINSELNSVNFTAYWKKQQKSSQLNLVSGIVFGKAKEDSILLNNSENNYALFSFTTRYLKNKDQTQWMLKSNVQLASTSLLGVAKASLGGASTVRGYRENTISRDNGLLISAQWLTQGWVQGLNFIFFTDYGMGWNKSDEKDQEHLLSIGSGFSWVGIKKLYAELMLGVPLINRSNENNNLQDYGLHFSVQYSIF